MSASNAPSRLSKSRSRLREAMEILSALQFGLKQQNETAAYTLLALLNLKPEMPWFEASAPLCGITPIIEFIAKNYRVRYAPNTRETIRDDAVKFFVASGLLLRNPDAPSRPTNSGKTVYQVEPAALELMRQYGAAQWLTALKKYQESKAAIQKEIARTRRLSRVPVKLSNGLSLTLSPGGQNPLIKAIIEEFCPRFAANSVLLYVGDTENKFMHMDRDNLLRLGVRLDAAAKAPDIIVYLKKKNWLLLIEAVTSAGPVDGKRRKELKELFSDATAGLVFVTAFLTRRTMQAFLPQISWESEVWIADDPDHMIHFNGERFLGPYPDVLPKK